MGGYSEGILGVKTGSPYELQTQVSFGRPLGRVY